MRNSCLAAGILITGVIFGLTGHALLAFSQDVPRGTGSWDGRTWGNHRAVVRVETEAAAVRVRIPWRRRDTEPEKKAVLVVDAATSSRLRNVFPVAINREFGEIVFEPATVPADYYVYYLPYRLTGSRNYPNARYLEPETTADPAWVNRIGLAGAAPSAEILRKMPGVKVTAIQAVDEFNSFWPMETIATAEETAALLASFPDAPFLLFPEGRGFSIRMADDLPQRWIESGPEGLFEGRAGRGEFYAFQFGLWACRLELEDVTVAFSDLRAGGAVIPSSAVRCFNTGGINWNGEPFRKTVSVGQGKVQALWCGIQVPADAVPGKYGGTVTVAAKGLPGRPVRLSLEVEPAVIADGGDGEPGRLSRLRWLDSTLAVDDDVVAPFTPLVVKGRTFSCLGRTVVLDETGFPRLIQSRFSPENTRLVEKGRDLLAGPMKFVVEDASGAPLTWKETGLSITSQKPGAVSWAFLDISGPLRLGGRARMEMDGFCEFEVKLSASEAVEVKDVRLEVPFVKEAARYMMGLGFKGGVRPAEFAWAWDQKKNQDALWMGDVNAGLQIGLRAENYSRPLNTNFYLSKPLNLPPSWHNEGRGGVTVREAKGGVVLFAAPSGARTIRPGQDLYFNFTLLITPFKLIDTKAQWATRFLHAYRPLDEAAATGANTLNIHHANAINPYINYPFLRVAEMKAYIDEAHRRGFRVKIYNTIRELSNRAPELFALRSLGSEIFSRGPGGGYSWLQEHLGGDYIAAWFVPDLQDAAIINSGMSRWHNYYVEGLNWLARNVGIDGLYIDDVAFDRTTMKRVRKVLERNRPAPLIDLHSANQYNPRDGFASSANLYLEHFPYIDRLWLGEYFDYNNLPPDYWLVEISGIPFGLTGEMLQGGGNPWRGMVYGMTNRLPWSGQNPAHIWKVWDDFGMADAQMIGYWVEDCPVKTDLPDVLATVYKKKGRALVSLASWAKGPVMARLRIDWKALGIDPAKARFRAPSIPGVQFETSFAPTDPIPFEPTKGWILILE
jgi:hypothetical protein